MTEDFIKDDQKKEILLYVKHFLGDGGIKHFREIKEINGSVNAIWMEPIELGSIYQYVPRNTNTQEGRQLRNYLKTLDVCKEWKAEDFEKRWIWVIEEAIKEDK